MKLEIKRFDELTAAELYGIMQLRVDVFVVEQRCPYRELDGLDKGALHVFIREGDEIEGYLRVLPAGACFECPALGRVVARKRGVGLGRLLVRAGIEAAREVFGAKRIMLEAQTYARGFYEKQGFRCVGAEFLEDGIPHIPMLWEE